jgi:WhiB family redox-sensing transcriptional regulator
MMSAARTGRPDLSATTLPLLDLTAAPAPVTRPARKPAPGAEPPPHWRDFAACVQEDLNLFFPMSTSGQAAERQVEAAKQVCRACPVQQSCLEWALEVGPEFGIFGGSTEAERRILRSRRSPAQRWRNVPAPFPHRSEEAVAQALEPR